MPLMVNRPSPTPLILSCLALVVLCPNIVRFTGYSATAIAAVTSSFIVTMWVSRIHNVS
jgi:hypothetical protein